MYVTQNLRDCRMREFNKKVADFTHLKTILTNRNALSNFENWKRESREFGVIKIK
jgi:hypothetical protein